MLNELLLFSFCINQCFVSGWMICADPNTVLAGDSVMVHLAMRRRAGLGKGKRIFTGTNAKLEKEGSVPSTMTSPAVTSTPLNGLDTPLNPTI